MVAMVVEIWLKDWKWEVFGGEIRGKMHRSYWPHYPCMALYPNKSRGKFWAARVRYVRDTLAAVLVHSGTLMQMLVGRADGYPSPFYLLCGYGSPFPLIFSEGRIKYPYQPIFYPRNFGHPDSADCPFLIKVVNRFDRFFSTFVSSVHKKE